MFSAELFDNFKDIRTAITFIRFGSVLWTNFPLFKSVDMLHEGNSGH